MDLDAIAHGGSRAFDCCRWDFQNRFRIPADWGEAPGEHVSLQMDDCVFRAQINHVNGEAHAESVDAPAGNDPEALSLHELCGAGAEESAQAGPMGRSDAQVVRQAGLASCVESRGTFPRAGHVDSLSILAYGSGS
jgi:hypothetical protein